MATASCIDLGESLTKLMADPAMTTQLNAAGAKGASAAEYVNLLAGAAPGNLGDVLRTEFSELPRTTMPIIVEAWKMASESGKTFAVTSTAPAEPIAFGRANRVRVTVDADNDSVWVTVSHVASRHADWYAPKA